MEYRPGAIYQYYYIHLKTPQTGKGFYKLDTYEPKTMSMDMIWIFRTSDPENGHYKAYGFEDRKHFKLAKPLAQVLYGTEKIKS